MWFRANLRIILLFNPNQMNLMMKIRTLTYFRIVVVRFNKIPPLAFKLLKKVGSGPKMNTFLYNFKKICNSSKVDQCRLKTEFVALLNKTRLFNLKMSNYSKIFLTHNLDKKVFKILTSNRMGIVNKPVPKIANTPNKVTRIRSSSFL